MVRIGAMLGLLTLALGAGVAHAQDVPAIEICTVEKTMERRTSCLQSNVDFLVKTIDKLGRDQQQKLDAATRQIDALKAGITVLQNTVNELKAAQTKPPKPAPPEPAKDQPAKDAGK